MPARRTAGRAEPSTRRAHILGETLRIVGERGYHGFGIQELADRCGLTKPGLLHHFGSKDQLLLSLLEEVDAKHQAELAELVAAYDAEASPEALRDMFRQAMCSVMARSLAQPALIRLRVVLRGEAINPDHPAHAYFVARQEANLARMAKRTAAFSSQPRSTARQILALMSGLEEQWLREGGGFDLRDEFDRALEALLASSP